ncbi:MAG: SDR family NAD(P)-dependent oxidoreductase [Gemmatimonadota bacterium]
MVTGSTDGLGREVTLRLGAMGAHVIVHDRNAARGDEIERGGQGSTRFFQTDLEQLSVIP